MPTLVPQKVSKLFSIPHHFKLFSYLAWYILNRAPFPHAPPREKSEPEEKVSK
jgi:hypothetical protein